jgi:hypothetical protein
MTGAHQVIDLNGNGLYDQLVITATVDAIVPEGDYDWNGQLMGPTGAVLGADHRQRPTLPRQKHPVRRLQPAAAPGQSGRRLFLAERRHHPSHLATITVAIPLLYTTPSYQAASSTRGTCRPWASTPRRSTPTPMGCTTG